jgi:uncharacterized surface protein with fasciclin (FAS1) repeats
VSTNEHPHPHRSTRRLVAVIALASLTGAACSEDASDSAAPSTTPETVASTVAPTTTLMEPGVFDIVGTALNAVVFTQLAGMVVDAGLVETLRSDGPFTVFAPTNDAFQKLPLATLHSVQDDPDLLASVLTYHVVPGKLMAADLEEGTLTTVSGEDLEVTREGDKVFINGYEITTADVEATNGVIHVMSDVLVPPSLS